MRGHRDIVEDLTLVASLGDRLVGCIMTSRATVHSDESRLGVLALGPVAVPPVWQGRGIGANLIEESLTLAREGGEAAVFLYGDPGYYSKFGFEDAKRWNITTADGHNFPAFMGLELQPQALDSVSGHLLESSLFEIDETLVDAFDATFAHREKHVTQTQL